MVIQRFTSKGIHTTEMLRYPVAYQKTFGKTGDPVEYTQEPFTRGK